jgi:hypothetical protein
LLPLLPQRDRLLGAQSQHDLLLRLLCGAAEPEESDAKQDKVFDGDSAIL